MKLISKVHRRMLLGIAVVALGLTYLASAAPASADVLTFYFDNDQCSNGGCGLSNYGIVTVTDVNGGGVTIDVSLLGGSGFVGTGALQNYVLLFNLPGWNSLTVTGLPDIASSKHFDEQWIDPAYEPSGKGFGSYNWGILCVNYVQPGNPCSKPYTTPLSFNINIGDVNFTTTDFAPGTGTNPKNTWFAGDISNPNVGAPLTGAIGATPRIPVPEPITLLLFGTGLVGIAAAHRRKKKASRAT